MSDSSAQDPREMYEEISALLGGMAKAFSLDDAQVISALEQGDIAMTFESDANGNRFALASYDGQTARLYPGAIKHDTEGLPQ